MKMISVVGARPNFMKIAPIADAVKAHNEASDAGARIEHVLVHTGQHYDERMSKLFFDELGIPRPDVDLEVGSATHAVQTAEVMKRFEPVCVAERPDAVLVVGDVNSTIACALVASKLGITVIHVEAGLRSFDRTMPEEINRVLTDAISDLLFVTERSGIENLEREGVSSDRVIFAGNVMIDTLMKNVEKAGESGVLARLGLTGGAGYAVMTLHRPSNVDDPDTLGRILRAVSEASTVPVIFPAHPRTTSRIDEFGLSSLIGRFEVGGGAPGPGIYAVEPMGYLDFLCLVKNSRAVFTDSGGIQEETTILGVPCVTMRENTERPVTITDGTNRLVGTEPARIVEGIDDALGGRFPKGRMPELWDGRASTRIVEEIARRLI